MAALRHAGWYLALFWTVTLSCVSASPVSIEALPGPGPGTHVGRIAVVPLIADPGGRKIEPDGPEIVTTRVVEALAMRKDIDFVAPTEVETWLVRHGRPAKTSDPQTIGSELARVFGADAVLFGVVHHYSSRLGGERGATRPAFVWFDLELRVPSGARIWAGSYREDQASLTEDLLSLPRAAQRGFTWLDSPGLAQYGARELIAKLAQERRKWK
jgi:hypothetical protein